MARWDRRWKAPEDSSSLGDARGEFRKDHDRLYYTPAFRRLIGITQVAAPHSEVVPLHNRYIHSDKVGQLGRSIAEYLRATLINELVAGGIDADEAQRQADERLTAVGGVDPDVVAAAGLAHDIGHPPFGHAGEAALHKLALEWNLDGFEGNAQTFRVLTKLAAKDERFFGLDLTRATRNAVLKYPWTYAEGPTDEIKERHRRKWSVYRSEIPDFREARAEHVLPPDADGQPSQSVEARLMELADDISYALHDFEDFYRTGLISVLALRQSSQSDAFPKRKILDAVKRSLGPRFNYDEAMEAWESVEAWLEFDLLSSLWRPYVGSVEQDGALVRLTSNKISEFIGGMRLTPGGEAPLDVRGSVEHAIAIWKQLTWQFVINSPGFAAVQLGQQRLVDRTTRAIREWIGEGGPDSPRLPRRLRDYISRGSLDVDDPDHPNLDEARVQARAVIDYVASLTEPELVDVHDKLFGAWRSTMIFGGVP